jgi:hypothetical protein
MTRRGCAVAALLSVGALAACGSNSAGEGDANRLSPAACAPTSSSLSPDASLASMAGDYRVVLVAEDSRSTAGDLSLREQPAGLRTLESSGTPLGGTLDIDLGAVGAQPVRSLSSTDPSSPGVLVLESDGAEGREILLRLGSEANRRDSATFDGAYAVLSVQSVGSNGFAGVWWSGVWDQRSEGYFCATAADRE